MTRPEELACPICRLPGRLRFELPPHKIFACSTCQHSYLNQDFAPDHVDQHYSDDYFTGGNAGYDDYLASRDVVVDHGRRYVRVVSKFANHPGRCFAIGAAAGFDLVGLHEKGWRVGGVEPNLSMCSYAKATFDFDIFHASLESLETDPLEKQFDLVIAMQVMAHLVDLQATGQTIAKLLKPGGLFLAETWNFRSVTARLFGKNWHEYSPPTVVQWFSPHSLELLMNQHGLTKVAVGRLRKFIRGEHATSLLRYKLSSRPLGRIALPFLNLVPGKAKLPYPSEDLFWMIFRRDEA